MTAITKNLFLEGRLCTSICLHTMLDFSDIFLFSRILSLKLLGRSFDKCFCRILKSCCCCLEICYLFESQLKNDVMACTLSSREEWKIFPQKILVKNLRLLGRKSLIQREVPLWGRLTFWIWYRENWKLLSWNITNSLKHASRGSICTKVN